MSREVNVFLWDRDDILCCKCSSLRFMHAHSPCEECDGKAVSRSTEYRHWLAAKQLQAQMQNRNAITYDAVPMNRNVDLDLDSEEEEEIMQHSARDHELEAYASDDEVLSNLAAVHALKKLSNESDDRDNIRHEVQTEMLDFNHNSDSLDLVASCETGIDIQEAEMTEEIIQQFDAQTADIIEHEERSGMEHEEIHDMAQDDSAALDVRLHIEQNVERCHSSSQVIEDETGITTGGLHICMCMPSL